MSSHVPAYGAEYSHEGNGTPTITIYALKENRRPVGFAPWPEERKPKRRRPKRKKRDE